MYSNPFAITIWVSHSKAEPKLVSRKVLKCLSELLLDPSAIFDGIETEHLFN